MGKIKTKQLTGKPVRQSVVEVTHIVQPPDINSVGTIFGGKVMAWIDLAAAACSNRHTRRVCVTASMDALHFLAPMRLGDLANLKAQVNYTHNTSLEIGVRVEAENPLTGERKHAASAYLTFVALDETGKPTAVPPIICKTPLEKQRFEEAKIRRKLRLKWKQKRKQEGR